MMNLPTGLFFILLVFYGVNWVLDLVLLFVKGN